MNELRTKVICEYYGMENSDFCKEKFKKRERKKYMGKIKGWCEKRKMGVKIRIKKKKKREQKGVGEDITNTDKFRTNGK